MRCYRLTWVTERVALSPHLLAGRPAGRAHPGQVAAGGLLATGNPRKRCPPPSLGFAPRVVSVRLRSLTEGGVLCMAGRSALWCARAPATWRPDYVLRAPATTAHQLSLIIDCGVSDAADCVVFTSRSPASEWLPFWLYVAFNSNARWSSTSCRLSACAAVWLIATRRLICCMQSAAEWNSLSSRFRCIATALSIR